MKKTAMAITVTAMTVSSLVLSGCSPLPAPLLEVSVDRTGDYGGGSGYYAVIDVENAGNCEVEATILTTINVASGRSATIENSISLNQKEKSGVRAEWLTDFDSGAYALESVAVDYRIDKCSDARRFY